MKMKRIGERYEGWLRWRSVTAALLARLSDEDAFQRYLQRTRQPATALSWEGFLRERHAVSGTPRRCC